MPFAPSIAVLTRLALLGCLCALATVAEAQRPFATLDPFYEEETARRGFYDGFAFQANVAYRGTEPLVLGAAVSPVALYLRLDYALAHQVDVAAVISASGGFGEASQAPVRVSWLIVKPYWRSGRTDYAVRLAIDPAGDSGFGFRQTDVAFLSTSDVGPMLSTDFAIGFRRARVGFERFDFTDDDGIPDDLALADALNVPELRTEVVRSRAAGTEFHIMWGYRFWLNPGGTHIFTTLSGEGMTYTLVSAHDGEQEVVRPPFMMAPRHEGRLRGGVGRFNAGMQYSRPNLLIAPYVSVPLFRFIAMEDEERIWGPRIDHARAGLRVTLR
jgi:hypothetical protein